MALKNCEEHKHEGIGIFNIGNTFFKRCQFHFLSEQGKSTSQMNSCAGLSPLPLKNCSTLALRKKAGKNHKTEWTNSLTACTQRLGSVLTDPNFILGCTRRRTCPASPGSGSCPSWKRLHTARPSLKELQLTPTRRKAQLQQHNPWFPLRWRSHTEIGKITVKLLFPPNLQPCVETQALKITVWNAQNPTQGTSSPWHHQMKNHDPRLLHWKTTRSQQAHSA